MIRMIHDEPGGGGSPIFSHTILRVEADLVDQLFRIRAKSNLAHLLLIFASFSKEGRPEPIIPPNESRDSGRR